MISQATIRLLLAALLTSLGALAGDEGAVRTWTDVNGRTVDAEFLWVDDSGVVLRKRDSDKTYTVPLNKLSDADRQWLAQRQQTTTPPADQAAPPQTQQTEGTAPDPPPAAGLPPLPEDPVEGLMAIAQHFNVRVPWLIGIAVLNIPLYVMWFAMFFGDLGGFFESLRYRMQPDLISLFRGQHAEDSWHEFKLAAFAIWLPATVIAQYAIVHQLFLS